VELAVLLEDVQLDTSVQLLELHSILMHVHVLPGILVQVVKHQYVILFHVMDMVLVL